ncbi:MAG: IclR family transcriptional regulator [Clostridia bacterium]
MIGSKDNTVQSLDRMIQILEELALHRDGCGVTSLASLTGLHKSTVHRLLNTLMSRGYISKNSENDRYSLGMRILYLGSAILDRMDVRTVAKPFLEKLCRDTDEVVHLSTLDDREAVYIDKVESPNKSIRMYSQIGKRVPLHCTGVGKILLAWLPDKEVEYLLGLKGMEAYTKNTITNIEDMKKHLAEIRDKGYAFDEIEHEEDIRCVAAPIFDMSGKVIASVSVSGPVMHVILDRMPKLTEEVLKTAKDISYQLGYFK